MPAPEAHFLPRDMYFRMETQILVEPRGPSLGGTDREKGRQGCPAGRSAKVVPELRFRWSHLEYAIPCLLAMLSGGAGAQRRLLARHRALAEKNSLDG